MVKVRDRDTKCGTRRACHWDRQQEKKGSDGLAVESIKASPAPQELIVTCPLNLEGCHAIDWGTKTDSIRFQLCVFGVLVEREQPVREQRGCAGRRRPVLSQKGPLQCPRPSLCPHKLLVTRKDSH